MGAGGISPHMYEEEHRNPTRYLSFGPGQQQNFAATNDGKVFFKNVKARLSEDRFNEFLLNIKRLNGKVQSKQQTMANVADLFGPENEDLLRNFHIIINPQLSSGAVGATAFSK